MPRTVRNHPLPLVAMLTVLGLAIAYTEPAKAQHYIPPPPLPNETGLQVPGQLPGQNIPIAKDPRGTQCEGCDGSPGVNSGPQQMADKVFLRKETAAAMAEQQIGRLAATVATNPELRAFGRTLAMDHQVIQTALRPVADSMMVQVPAELDKKSKAEWTKLNSLSGEAFDAEYVRYLAKDLRAVDRDFVAEIAMTANPGLRNIASRGEAVLRQRLGSVQTLASSMGPATALAK